MVGFPALTPTNYAQQHVNVIHWHATMLYVSHLHNQYMMIHYLWSRVLVLLDFAIDTACILN